jgi:hypothetical protein
VGFLDDVKRQKEIAEKLPPGGSRMERARRAQEVAAETADRDAQEALAPGAEWPFVDRFGSREGKHLKLDMAGLVEAYIASVGLDPADMFGIYPTKTSEYGVQEMAIAYRDKPQYGERRRAFRAKLEKK